MTDKRNEELTAKWQADMQHAAVHSLYFVLLHDWSGSYIMCAE